MPLVECRAPEPAGNHNDGADRTIVARRNLGVRNAERDPRPAFVSTI